MVPHQRGLQTLQHADWTTAGSAAQPSLANANLNYSQLAPSGSSRLPAGEKSLTSIKNKYSLQGMETQKGNELSLKRRLKKEMSFP